MRPMTHATSRPPKTIDDYLALPDEVRAELIGGEIYMTPAPTPRHSEIGLRLGGRIEAWASASRWGRVFGPPCDLHLPSGDVVEPDLLVVSRANAGIVLEKYVRGRPDLVVEVISGAHPERDRIVKHDLYEENGIPEFWLVDTAEKAIEVFRLGRSKFRPAGWFSGGTVLETPTLPGFRLAVDDLFA